MSGTRTAKTKGPRTSRKAVASKAVDFNFNFDRDVSVYPEIGVAASYHVEAATNCNNTKGPRARGITSLTAARYVLAYLGGEASDSLRSALENVAADLESVETELRDLEAGTANGPITSPKPGVRAAGKRNSGGRPRRSSELEAQALAVLGVDWLSKIKLVKSGRMEAVRAVADAMGETPAKVKNWVDNFDRDNTRSAEMLSALMYEAEVERPIFDHPREAQHATDKEILAYVKVRAAALKH